MGCKISIRDNSVIIFEDDKYKECIAKEPEYLPAALKNEKDTVCKVWFDPNTGEVIRAEMSGFSPEEGRTLFNDREYLKDWWHKMEFEMGPVLWGKVKKDLEE